MLNLNVVNIDGKNVVDSLEVSQLIGKQHKNLMRDIKNYIEAISESSDLSYHDFFIEGTYINNQNKELPCYLLTKQGCEMVANKLTGQKGILFTATYVDKFNKLENSYLPKTHLEITQLAINQLVEQDKKLKYIEEEQIKLKENHNNIKEVLLLNKDNWKNETTSILNKIVKETGRTYQEIRNECYKHLELRGKCNLAMRQANKKKRLEKEGANKTQVSNVSKLDIIGDDQKLIEIFLSIVKEMAIQHSIII